VSARKQADKDAKIQELRDANAQKASPAADPPLSKRAQKRAKTMEKKKLAEASPPQDSPPPAAGALLPQGDDLSPKPKEAESPKMTPIPGGSPPEAPPAKPTPEPAATPNKEMWKPRPLDPKTVDRTNKFDPTYREIQAAIACDLFPTEEKPKTAEDLVSELLASRKNVSSDTKYEEHVATVESLKAQIKLGTEGSAADEALKDIIAKEEVAMEKAKKHVPSTEVLTCALKVASQTWQMSVKERSDRAKAGKARAEERKRERLEKISLLEQELAAIKTALIHHDPCYEEAHRERSLAREQEDERVTDLIAAKVAEEVEKERVKSQQDATEGAKAALQNQSQELKDSIASYERLKKEQEAQAEKIRQLQAATLGQNTPPKRLSANDVVETADVADLPAIPADLLPENLAKCEHLFHLLERWNMCGCLDVTFKEFREALLAHHPNMNPRSFDLTAFDLLGEKLWSDWFGTWARDGATWTSDFEARSQEIMPRQSLCFLYAALKKLEASYQATEEIKSTAKTSYMAMSEASKRRRMAD
jgi:hypothetical protein